ncbi:MAG: helix-turn-helix domain-containing protein [Clostridia bacterium]|nr:helix-turn-helix domain-containing protein [Clostridia bacterium]
MKKAVWEKGVYSFNCPSDSTRLHEHPYFEISYVLSGSAVHYIEEKGECEIKCGDYFIIDLKTRHKYHASTPGSLVIMNTMFIPEYLTPMLIKVKSFSDVLDFTVSKPYSGVKLPCITDRIFHDDTGKIKELLCNIQEEFRLKSFGYVENIRALLTEFMIETVRKAGVKKRTQNEPVTAPIKKYIAQNYSRHVSLGDLCKRIGYSEAHISRLFKEENGVSFKSYLQQIRINESCRLLLTTNENIIDIAERVGYSNMKFFNKIFKEHTGKTPKEYRNR